MPDKRIQPGQSIKEPPPKQIKEETQHNSIREALKGICRNIEKEREKKERGFLNLQKKIQDLKRSQGKDSGEEYSQVQVEILERNERA